MKLWMLTSCHVDAKILEFSMERLRATTKLPFEHVFLDHHWPEDYWQTRHKVLEVAEKYNCRVMSNYQNLGGHQGYNWSLGQLPLQNNDLIVTYDPDSNPITEGWLEAMVEAMEADKNLAYLSLLPNVIHKNRIWNPETISGTGIKICYNVLDMVNVTIWRMSFLTKTKGILGNSWYGHIESQMAQQARYLSLKHAFLYDYREDECPIPHTEKYVQWKKDVAFGGCNQNFAEYLCNK